MKHVLLLFAAGLLATTSWSQCTADYDFGEAGFGISPDPVEGEQFEEGVLNEPYEDVLHVLVPSTGDQLGDLIPEEYAKLAAFIDIDSLTLELVEVLLTDTYAPIEDLGLMVECNNNGDSPEPCHFMGGSQYCAALSGTPNQAGVFQMRITVNIYFTLFGEVQEVPQTFEDDFFLTINETSDNIQESAAVTVSVGQNTPNPASGRTRVSFTLSTPAQTTFTVTNLLGEVVHTETFAGRRGTNELTFDASELNAGIYLYSVEAGQNKITKRMIVR